MLDRSPLRHRSRRPRRRAGQSDASSVKEQQLLDQLNTVRGAAARIPDTKSYTIEHPAGRDWRQFRTSTLKWIGGVAILGMIVLLAIFYLYRGASRSRKAAAAGSCCASPRSSASCTGSPQRASSCSRSRGST